MSETSLSEQVIHAQCSEWDAKVYPRLEGKAFHQTGQAAYQAICRDSKILPYKADSGRVGLFRSPSISYAQAKELVAFWDYRGRTINEINSALLHPLHAHLEADPVYYLVLRPEECSKLHAPEEAGILNHVPDLEHFYQGLFVPIEAIERVIIVKNIR